MKAGIIRHKGPIGANAVFTLETMTVSDLDRLAQSVRRALDRIDLLEAEKRRLEADYTVLEARLTDGGKDAPVNRLTNPANSADNGHRAEAQERLTHLIKRLHDLEQQL